MLETQIVQGRRISSVELAEIRALIQENPQWSRWRLSRVLAQRWQWYAASGQLKDMAARTLLLKLQRRGDLVLPERRHAPVVRGSAFHPDLFDSPAPEPIIADLLATELERRNGFDVIPERTGPKATVESVRQLCR